MSAISDLETNLNGKYMNVIAMNGFGPIETFKDEKREVPSPQEGEIRIRIKAASFNPVDYKIRQNWYGGDPRQVLGFDCSGVVDAIGQNEKRFSLKDEVCAMSLRSSNGSYAEYSCVPESLVAIKPQNLTFEEAASVPLAAMTAYRATIAASAVTEGDKVLVVGAGGGVGSFAVQLLRLAKVAKIYTIAKNEMSAEFLEKNLGFSRQDIIFYEGLPLEKLKEKLLKINNGRFFDATFDLVGGEMKRLCLDLTNYSGHFSTIVPEAKFEYPFWEENSIPRARNLSVHQVNIGAELGCQEKEGLQIYERHLNIIANLLASGDLKVPFINVVGSLSSKTVQKAHRLLEGGHVKGKLVMVVEK